VRVYVLGYPSLFSSRRRMGAIADKTWADIAAMEMEISKCTASGSRSLCDCPSELIGLIAECLDKKDLHALWCVRNRFISKAIDHVWVSKVYF
jgi:hypothetical protein